MEKERRLQGGRRNIAPIDDPVEIREPVGVFKGIEDERRQAEKIEVGGAGRGPAAEEDIEPDPEIDQRDKAEALVQAVVGRIENDWVFNTYATPLDGVGRRSVRFGAKHLPIEAGYMLRRVPVGFDEHIADCDAGFLAGAAGQHTVGAKAPVALKPRHSIDRGLLFRLLREVDPGENNRGQSEKGQQNNRDSSLERLPHTHWTRSDLTDTATGLPCLREGRAEPSLLSIALILGQIRAFPAAADSGGGNWRS